MSKTYSQFVNEAINLPAARTVDGVINQIVSECFSMIVLSRVRHLNTSLKPEHDALESFYTAMQSHQDDLCESYIATGGVLEDFSIPVSSSISSDQFLGRLESFRDLVSGGISLTGDSDLQSMNDHLVSIQKTIDQTIYLLGLN